jgi:nitrile hydratase accessory protein
MALALHERGLFTWSEWAAALGREIARGGEGDPQDSSRFYEQWLAALEGLVREKGLTTHGRLESLRNAFERAARATPHGAPVLLENDPLRAVSEPGAALQSAEATGTSI